MSFYDDASLVFLAGGAAGKDGKAYNLKPYPNLVGGELAVDGTFDDAAGWTTSVGNTNWTVTGGKAVCDGQQSTGVSIYRSMGVLTGKIVRISFEVSDYVGGQVGLAWYGTGDTITYFSGNGTHVHYHTVGSGGSAHNGNVGFLGNADFEGKVDNLSIVEADKLPADFTFTRGSNLSATRVGPDGFIEKGRENLLLYSNQFDDTDTWKNGTFTGGQSGYDGSSDAWEFVAASAGNNFYQTVSPSGVNTASFYVKGDGSTGARIFLNGPSTTAFFRLSDSGEVTSSSSEALDASITPVSGASGWYRISLTFYDDGTSSGDYQNVTRVYVYTTNNGTSNAAGTIYVQDAQLEQGLVATDYIETGATTATAGLLEDEPRFDYTGGGCPALLMEPQMTNKLIHSEYFNDYWATQDASVTDNATTSPEGLINAAKLIPDNGTGGNRSIGKNFTGLSGVHTFSVFAKAAGHDYIALRMRNPGNGFVMFNLSDGSVENEVSGSNQYVANSAKIESFGNDWYRCSASFDPSQSTTVGQLFVSLSTGIDGTETSDFDGDGTNGVFIYGAQLEANEFTTSYIPTYGSSATRDQDVTEELEHGITMGTTCSVFFEGKHLAPNIGQLSFFQLRTDDDNRLLIYGSGNTSSAYNLIVQHRVATISVNAAAKALNIGDSFKVLARMDDTTMDVFINGELHDTKTITAQDHFGKMNLYRTGAALQSGHEVSQAILFTTALSNNDSEILTGATSYRSFNVMRSALNYTAYE